MVEEKAKNVKDVLARPVKKKAPSLAEILANEDSRKKKKKPSFFAEGETREEEVTANRPLNEDLESNCATEIVERPRLASENLSRQKTQPIKNVQIDSLQENTIDVSLPPTEPELPPLPPGYEYIEKIAHGGYGEVWLAHNSYVQRKEAVKILKQAREIDHQRFCREIRITAGLSHPNIMTIYYANPEQMYFIMEYLDGGTFGAFLKSPRYSLEEGLEYFQQILEGLEFAHKEGLVHRDLKPENILFSSNQTPKVTDFGLAKQTADEECLTGSYVVMGTPIYMAPEQWQGARNVDHRCDIWAMGVILYRMLAGQVPFPQIKGIALGNAIIGAKIPTPSEVRADLSFLGKKVEKICLKALEKDSSRRYQSMGEMNADLGKILKPSFPSPEDELTKDSLSPIPARPTQKKEGPSQISSPSIDFPSSTSRPKRSPGFAPFDPNANLKSKHIGQTRKLEKRSISPDTEVRSKPKRTLAQVLAKQKRKLKTASWLVKGPVHLINTFIVLLVLYTGLWLLLPHLLPPPQDLFAKSQEGAKNVYLSLKTKWNRFTETIQFFENPSEIKETSQNEGPKEFPHMWPEDLWKQCWNKEDQLVDFTSSFWEKLPSPHKNVYAREYQKWYAQSRGLEVVHTFRVLEVPFTMVLIPPGKSWIGSSLNEVDRTTSEVRYKAKIKKAFWLGQTEVNQKQWQQLTQESPWEKEKYSPKETDAVASYISLADIKLKLLPRLGPYFGLPREEEWEYACRSGSVTRFYWGDDLEGEEADKYAWHTGNTFEKQNKFSQVNSLKRPNTWDLYDMSGNVAEWCVCSPFFKIQWPDKRIPPYLLRGGSWRSKLSSLRSASRSYSSFKKKREHQGLRLKCSLLLEEEK